MNNSNKDMSENIKNILIENLGEDYDDLERPDYDAMLYAIRDMQSNFR